MNFTATLIAQIITFGILVWFVMRFLWGPLTNLMEQRKQKIAEGLSAAERGKADQERAKQRAAELLVDAKAKSAEIINQAQKRAAEIVDEAKEEARAEGERILTAAQADIELEVARAREQLRTQVTLLVVAGAEKILRREVDAEAHTDILNAIATEL